MAANILPYHFGSLAVMMLGGVMLASGIVALLCVNAARKEGIPVSIFVPWVQVIAGLTALRDSGLVNPPVRRKIELWSSVVLGALLIVLGGAGSAILLGIVLVIALISTGFQRWRMAA